MPLSKYRIRNEYGLADPELYRAADKDDPEALLEAVAMAGLVGLLRQLGDLSEFAAQIFHDLHEEVMATAARGHGLMSRVKQLEAEVPSLEKAFFSQTHHSSFFTNGGIDWHPNLRSEQNLITNGDLPRFVMDSYEECRGPPRLFLLDKFDVAGAGACLKRYTDPSSFKMESASSIAATAEVHREKRIRKVKKKGAWLRDGEAPNVVPTHAKLHQLLLEERIENGYTNPARLVKLKKRQLNGPAVEAKAGKCYMEKFLETPSPDHKMICETSIFPQPVKLTLDDTSEAGIKILEISSISPVKKSLGNENTCSFPNGQEKSFSEVDGETNGDLVKVKEQISAGVTDEVSSDHLKLPDETELAVDEQKKLDCSLDEYHSDDVASEVDNYVDALTTMESELDTDSEYKPKKSFLNIQKAKDTDDKEEHHPQARFSDSQSFGDSSTSDDISSFKQDRNEEHIEVQAQLSDSHSIGTSSTSDNNSSFRGDGNEHIEMQGQFSDSQSVANSSTSDENSSFKKDRSCSPHSTLVENIQSEPILLTNTEYYEPKIEDAPSNQLPPIVEFQSTDCGSFVMHDDAHVNEEEISESRKSSYDMMTSGLVLSSDLVPVSPVTLPVGTQLDETPSDHVEHNLRLDDDAKRTDLLESIASKTVSLSPIKDDACPADSSDNSPLENLDGDDPFVHCNNLLHVSDDLESSHGDECCDHSETKMFRAESTSESSSESLVSRDIGSNGEDPIRPSTEELDLNSGTILALDCRDSKDEDCIIATQFNSEDLSPVAVPSVSCFSGELSSDSTCNDPEDEPVSAEIEVLYSDQQAKFEEVPKMVDGNEISGSTCSVDPVEGDDCFKHRSVLDSHVMINDMVAENVLSEDQAVYSRPSVDSVANDTGINTCLASDQISSPSRELSSLQEPVAGSYDSYQLEMDSNEAELTQMSVDSNAEKRENQIAPSLGVTSSDIAYPPMSSITELEESLSTIVDQHEEEREDHKAVATETLTDAQEQKIVDQPECSSAYAQLDLNKSVLCDLSDSEIWNNIQNSSPMEKFQHHACVDDAKMVPVFSGLDTQQSESSQNDLIQIRKDSFLSPSCNQLESETDSVLFSQSQVSEQDAKLLPRDEENFASEKSQSQQMQMYQLEQESTLATSERVSEIHADEPSSCYSLPQSSVLENNPTKHAMDPLIPLLPDLSFKATENNLDEVPPLPPLPPMQWRMGKVQHAFLAPKREELGVSQTSVQSMQPIKPDNNSHFALPTSERETLLYQSPFLPVMAVESEKLQHSSGFSMGVSGHPLAIPFQYPIMVNEAKGQYNYLFLDRNQIQNPFLTLPMVSTSMPPHGYVDASEGEMVQNPNLTIPPAAYAVHDFVSLQEKPTQPPSQVISETSSKDKTLHQSTSNLVSMDGPQHGHTVAAEGVSVQNSNQCPPIPPAESVSGHDSISPRENLTQPPSQLMTETSSVDKMLPQSISNAVSMDGSPHSHIVASEGEMVQNSDSYPLVAPAECATQEKLTQPPSQLMTETGSEVKTLDQSTRNVEREQGWLPLSLMLPANLESMEPDKNPLNFEGEMASSLDTSAQLSDFESESTNGKPKNKLPRPRNPLIDAVAAHDKSKLRRVTERVMPQTAPKVDERDSLLEQIRTKSFNLKPAVTARPSIQGPKTNLKLAAILEKANAIRQALTGSDEDDDADSWSDS